MNLREYITVYGCLLLVLLVHMQHAQEDIDEIALNSNSSHVPDVGEIIDLDNDQKTKEQEKHDSHSQNSILSAVIMNHFNETRTDYGSVDALETILEAGIASTNESDSFPQHSDNIDILSSKSDSNETEKNGDSLKIDHNIQNNAVAETEFMRASFWELFKAQVARDFEPILILIPGPVKRFIGEKLSEFASSAWNVASGFIEPMLRTIGNIFNYFGKSLTKIGDDMLLLAEMSVSKVDKTRTEPMNYQIAVVSTDNEQGIVEDDEHSEDTLISSAS